MLMGWGTIRKNNMHTIVIMIAFWKNVIVFVRLQKTLSSGIFGTCQKIQSNRHSDRANRVVLSFQLCGGTAEPGLENLFSGRV